MSIKLKPLSGVLGAEIEGVNLAKPVDENLLKELRDAFSRYHVICFRGQTLTPEHHLAFAKQWGRINVNRFFKPVQEFPMIAEVSKEQLEYQRADGLPLSATLYLPPGYDKERDGPLPTVF